MQNTKKALALFLSAAMLAGCGTTSSGSGKDKTLVVGESQFNSKFSPFFAETQYDRDVSDMTQISVLTNDRTGELIYKSIEGEKTEYNGKEYEYTGPTDVTVKQNSDGSVDYNIKLKDGIKFSDGEPVTADDIIFTLYVLADPTYDGNASFYSIPVEGMDEYRNGMESLYSLLVNAGEDNKEFKYWDEATQKEFWEDVNGAAGEKYAQAILDSVVAQGAAKEEDSVATKAKAWGYELAEDATAADFFKAIVTNPKYKTVAEAVDTEKADKSLIDCMSDADKWKSGVETGNSTDSIKGIKKVSDTEVSVHATKTDATAIYQLGVNIAPMHYYGEADKYDYENNKFGFEKGDLSHVRAATSKPMGAGPYKFVKFENGTVYFEANENYFKGAPKIKYVNFLESQESDLLNGVTTGTIDIASPAINAEVVDAITQSNSNGELTGDKISTQLVDFLGYGYVGMSAKALNINGEIDSEASKNLRKALATIISVYRDVAIDSYYGDRAEIINYPISGTSWAAPVATDPDYKVAFSTDVEGNDIYTSDMDADAKYAAAKEASLGFFKAAGFTVENGKVTAAPAGLSTVEKGLEKNGLSFTVTIPAGGAGDHPTFMCLDLASKAFADIGITFTVNDLSDGSQLWDAVNADSCEMWAAAWSATIDPDMFQIYYSDVANGGENAGGSNYMYDIADPQLDELIMDARSTIDQSARKGMYKACLDIIIDWAVEIPVYQRKDCVIFSTERVNMDTVVQDVTPFYTWRAEIETLDLN